MGIVKTLLRFASTTVLIIAVILVCGCARERPSRRPPVHLNPNMDRQEKYTPQGESKFFADGSAMRTPVAGTVARGQLHDNMVYFTGKDSAGVPVDIMPVEVALRILQRGRERYDIYCSPCHSRVGDGQGIMIQRGYVPPLSFHQDYVRNYADGHLFDVITNGIRNMPAYAHQIPVSDRWAIIAYVRALQRSRNATRDDIPAELRDKAAQ